MVKIYSCRQALLDLKLFFGKRQICIRGAESSSFHAPKQPGKFPYRNFLKSYLDGIACNQITSFVKTYQSKVEEHNLTVNFTKGERECNILIINFGDMKD